MSAAWAARTVPLTRAAVCCSPAAASVTALHGHKTPTPALIPAHYVTRRAGRKSRRLRDFLRVKKRLSLTVEPSCWSTIVRRTDKSERARAARSREEAESGRTSSHHSSSTGKHQKNNRSRAAFTVEHHETSRSLGAGRCSRRQVFSIAFPFSKISVHLLNHVL